ncbi:MAG: hypothetical protein K1X71_12785 [Pirellulales bacterium]|nr:hypothetical protein [Pirellulales bacterium]
MRRMIGIDITDTRSNGEVITEVRLLTDDGEYVVFYDQPSSRTYGAFRVPMRRYEEARDWFVRDKLFDRRSNHPLAVPQSNAPLN